MVLHKKGNHLEPVFGVFYFVCKYMMSSNTRDCIEVSLRDGTRQIELEFAAIARDVIMEIKRMGREPGKSSSD